MSLKAVVLSYNHPGITKKCLESVQKFFLPQDVFLVHNGSSLENVIEMKDFATQVRHIVIDKNCGFAGGANRGISEAFTSGCDTVFFFSNDTCLSRFDASKWAKKGFANVLVAPRIEIRQTGRIHSLGGQVDFLKGELRHISSQSDRPTYVPGSAFLVGREAWQKLGGFDETLYSYWEDVDLSLRAKPLGISIVQAPEIAVTHGISKTCGGEPLYSVYYFQRNRKRVILRHGTFWSSLGFRVVYFWSVIRKLFNYLRKKDVSRAKLILKAAVS